MKSLTHQETHPDMPESASPTPRYAVGILVLKEMLNLWIFIADNLLNMDIKGTIPLPT